MEEGAAEGGRRRDREVEDAAPAARSRDQHPRFVLNKNGGNAAAAAAGVATLPPGAGMPPQPMPLGPANGQRQAGSGNAQARGGGACPAPPPQPPTEAELAAARARKEQALAAAGAQGTEAGDALLERNAAFEQFRRSYRKAEAIEDNKLLLKQKYDEAKRLGESVNASRGQINQLKSQLEACRRERAVSELAASEGGAEAPIDTAAAEQEERLKAQMEEGKRSYKEGFAKLKELKAEIEHLQHLLEQSRRKLQQDFEGWYAKQQQGGQAAGGAPSSMQGSPMPLGVRQPPPVHNAPSGAARRGGGSASGA